MEELSDTYTKQGNPTLALESAEQLLAIAKRVESPNLELNGLRLLSNVHRNQGNYQKSLEFSQQYLALAQTKNPTFEVLGLLDLSQSYIDIGNPAKAMEVAQQALTLGRRESNSSHEGAALMLTSQALKLQGKYEQGIETARQAIEISRKNNTFFLEAGVTVTLSGIYEALGEYQNVITLTEPILTRIEQLDNPVLEANALITLGNAYSVTGNYTKGKNLVDQGLAIARRLKNPAQESRGLVVLGSLNNSLNDYQQALQQNQQSLKIAQALPNPFLQIGPLYALGESYYNLGDYNNSAKFYQQALTIAQQFNNSYNEGIALLNLASTAFAQGNPQKTVDFSQKALTIFKNIKEPRLEAFAHRMLSIGYGELGNDAKAMEAAQSFLTFARKTKNSVWEKTALSLLGSLHNKFGRKDAAIAAYQQAIAIKTDEQVTGADAYIYAGLARIDRDLNRPTTAITYYQQAISGIEQARRNIQGLPSELQKSFLNATFDFDKVTRADIYRDYANVLLSQGRNTEAEEVIELLKLQELTDFTTGTGGGEQKPIAQTPIETKIIQKYGSLIAFGQRFDACNNCPEKKQLGDERDALITEYNQNIKRLSKLVRDRLYQDRTNLNIEDDFKRLSDEIVKSQDSTVMINVLVVDNKTWLLWTSKGGVRKSVEVPVSEKKMGEVVKRFRELLQNPNSDIAQVNATGKQLYDWLIKPIEPELKTNKIQNLVFSLDRSTRYVPIAALFDGEKYLIENYSVSTVLSAGLTDTTDQLPKGTQNTSVLALGASQAPGFNSLPHVPAEIGAIVRKPQNGYNGIYPGEAFLNRAFDYTALRDNLKGHKILHIATHGEFVPGRQDDSYLALGTGERLAIPKIENLQDLSDVHLVVLSACETALGETQQQSGIEIPGISFYFLRNGAKAAIASLWKVNDPSTTQLMQQFYRNLATETTSMTKAQALRQAQLSLLGGQIGTRSGNRRSPEEEIVKVDPLNPNQNTRQGDRSTPGFSHPYYWAPFILIGNSL